MNLQNITGNTLNIQASSNDIAKIVSVLKQADNVDYDWHGVLPEQLIAIQKLLESNASNDDNDQNIRISKDDFFALSKYMSAASNAHTRTLEGVTEADLEELDDKLSLIDYSLRPEDEILKIEDALGVEIPRNE